MPWGSSSGSDPEPDSDPDRDSSAPKAGPSRPSRSLDPRPDPRLGRPCACGCLRAPGPRDVAVAVAGALRRKLLPRLGRPEARAAAALPAATLESSSNWPGAVA